MEKPNAIELQIAHGSTPIPFMVPLKKAVSRQALEEVIRRRSNCGSAPVITMYTRNMVIIDWEDWEELIEPGKRYLADLDGSWILHSRARGHGTSIESINMFLGAIEKGKTPASIPMPVSQIGVPAAQTTVPASTLQKAVTATEKEAAITPVRPSEQTRIIPRPAIPKLGYMGYIPRQSSNLNPNSSTFPVPIGPAGMGHGIVNPAVEREVLEELQQQIGTLAVEKPATARQSSVIQQSIQDEDRLSTVTESDDSDEPTGGVRLNALSAPPSVGKVAQDVQELSDVSPQTAKTGLSNTSKQQSVSPIEKVNKMHISPAESKKMAGQSVSPQALSSISSQASNATKHAPAKSVAKEPTPVQTSSTGATAVPKPLTKNVLTKPVSKEPGTIAPFPGTNTAMKTFTTPVPFQPAPAKPTPVDPVHTKRAKYPNHKSGDNEKSSQLDDSLSGSGVGSSPGLVQKAVSSHRRTIGSSGDDEYEAGDEAYKTTKVPGPSKSILSGPGAAKPVKKGQQGKQDDKRQQLLKDENRVTFYLIKPENKDKPIVQDGRSRIFISTSKDCCALRLIKLLRKNVKFTRLLILIPAPDMSRYMITDVINPGSRFAQAPFSVVGFDDDVTMSWEHIENDQEDEIINEDCPWDQPDVINDQEPETYDYDDDGEDAEEIKYP
ncbi:hypothetical protein TWF506_003951 [Arthrobotrys conoides]|uniref:Uncharacterized protein n=1 Tax=Arthrobotrys conoides TaxID=74498 RepID=A0AAN8NG53_9PEZI